MQAFAFTSRPQKHKHQWNYSPPGMKEGWLLRYAGKSKHHALRAWAVPRTGCSKFHYTNRALQPWAN